MLDKPKAVVKLSPDTQPASPVRFAADMKKPRTFTARGWSVRHAGRLEKFYSAFEGVLKRLHPLLRALGYSRLERPVAVVEKGVKGFLFDCRMCGQCILSSTGMSCPMNCPKQLRNGPCGGVRPDGNCEVIPEMACVWVKAWEGSRRMKDGDAILNVQPPVNQMLRETSSWLRAMRAAAGQEGAP